MSSEIAAIGDSSEQNIRVLPDPVLDDADARVVCFRTGERVQTALQIPSSEPPKIEKKPVPTRPPTYLETLLKRHNGSIDAFYTRNGGPETNEEKIALLVQHLNAPKNLDLGNLELRLLWYQHALSNTELSYFV